MGRGHHLNRSLEIIEGLLCNSGRDIGGYTATWISFIHHYQLAGVLHTFNDCLHVDWWQGPQVNHFTFNTVLSELICCFNCPMDHQAIRDYGDITAFTQYISLSKRNGIRFRGNISRKIINIFMFAKNYRIVVPYRLYHQAFGIIWCRRTDYLEARNMSKNGGQSLWVLRGGWDSSPIHCANYHRCLCFSSEHITEFCCLIKYLIKTNAQKIDKHQFCDRAHATGRGANGCSDKCRFGKGGVKYSRTIFWEKSLINTHSSSPSFLFSRTSSTTCNVFSH